jgi:hypothetical protein
LESSENTGVACFSRRGIAGKIPLNRGGLLAITIEQTDRISVGANLRDGIEDLAAGFPVCRLDESFLLVRMAKSSGA